MEKNIFTEKQKFTQPWLWLLILMVLFVHLFMAMSAIIPISVTLLLVTTLVALLFFIFELRTTIDKEGIRYRFFPFQGKERSIKWTDVQEVYVRPYKPLLEYGGWGYRFGFKGKALTTRGNMGLQLVLKNGRKILIGTQRAKELEEFMRETVNHNPNLV